jgi:hypothetical protein
VEDPDDGPALPIGHELKIVANPVVVDGKMEKEDNSSLNGSEQATASSINQDNSIPSRDMLVDYAC